MLGIKILPIWFFFFSKNFVSAHFEYQTQEPDEETALMFATVFRKYEQGLEDRRRRALQSKSRRGIDYR